MDGAHSTDFIDLFNPKDQPYGELSNNARSPIIIDKDRWPTVTNYIYGMLLTKPTYRDLLQNEKTKNVHKSFLELYQRTTNDITSLSLDIALNIKFRIKYTQEYPNGDPEGLELRKVLLDTGNSPIHYISNNDVLGVGKDYTGYNLYGRYLVQLRNRIRTAQESSVSADRDAVFNHSIYEAYMAQLALRNRLYSNNDPDLGQYKDMTPSMVLETLGTENLPPISKESVINMYHKNMLNRSIDYAVEGDKTARPLVAYVRKTELASYRQSKLGEVRGIVLDMYADSILERDYPDLKYEQYKKARDQQFTASSSYAEMNTIRDELWNLYVEKKFGEDLQKQMEMAVEPIRIPSEEDVIAAVTAASYPEMSASSSEFPPAVSEHDEEQKRDAASSYIDNLLSTSDSPGKKGSRSAPKLIDMSVGRTTSKYDIESVLDSIKSLEAQRETYLDASVSSAVSKEERSHSVTQAKEILTTINKTWASIDTTAMEKKVEDLLESAEETADQIKHLREIGRRPTTSMLDSMSKDKEEARALQVRVTEKYNSIGLNVKEKEKQDRKEARKISDNLAAATDLHDQFKQDDSNLRDESRFAVKIYSASQGAEKQPFGELSPMAYTGMLNIDGRTYPTVIHYVLVSLIAALPSIKSIKSAYPIICNDPVRCKILDIPYSEDVKNFKPSAVVQKEYLTLQEENYISSIKRNASTALDRKFEDRRLQDLLTMTGTAEIRWADKSDPILGIGPNDKGMNFVGKHLMILREKYYSTRNKDDIHMLSETDVATVLLNDEFLQEWLKMRIRDMCHVVSTIRSYLYLKDSISPPITDEFVKTILDKVYQPCSELYVLSNMVTVPVPEYFRRVIEACPGFSGKDYAMSSDSDSDDDDDYAARALRSITKQRHEGMGSKKSAKITGQKRIDAVVDLIWSRLAVLIYMVIKSISRPTVMNTRGVIAKAITVLSTETECVRLISDEDGNCIVSAIINVMMGLYEFNRHMKYNTKVTATDVYAATSIVLDHDVTDEIEPANIEEFMDDDDIPIGVKAPKNPNSRSASTISTVLRREFGEDIVDSDEISALILGAVETIQSYPSAETVKRGRINFFATLLRT